MADAANGAEQVNRVEHVIKIVRRFAHAHENDTLDRTFATRKYDLRDDFGAADLAQQAIAAGHAKNTADRAADLRRHANAVARQEHAFHRLPVAKRHEQAC